MKSSTLPDPETLRPTEYPDHADAASRDAHARRLSFRVVLASVGVGILLRIVHYLHHNSYWNDEAALVMNVLHRGYADLLKPLDFAQAAPPLFLWLERLLYRVGGRSEYILRAPPALMGLIALPCFATLAWRLLRPAAAAWAVAFFSVNDRIIPQVTEVKQYSADILVSTLLLLVAFGGRRERSTIRRLAIISLIASLGIWFSFPTAIAFGGILIVLLPQALRRHPRDIWKVIACLLPPLLSAALLARIVLAQPPDPYLHEFWAAHFADLRHPLTWLAAALFDLGDYPFASMGVLVLLLAAVGAWTLRQRGNRTFVTAVLATLALAVLTSAARVYPFGGSRVSLYLFPPMFLLLGAAASAWGDRSSAWYARAWWLLPTGLFLLAAAQCALHAVRPVVRSNIRPVAQYVLDHRNPTQPIYLAGAGGLPQTRVSGRNVEFLCYWPGDETNIHRLMPEPEQIRDPEFWVVYTTVSTDKRSALDALLQRLEKVARPTDQHFSTGPAGATLYHLAAPPPASRPARGAQ